MSGGPFLKHLVKQVSVVADRLLPKTHGVVVLIYHRVGGGSASEVDLDRETFETQLEFLASHHHVLALGDAVASLTSGQPTSGVVLTFDDGTADFTDVVVPALERHGLPATLYAATQFIDEGVPFPWGAPPTSWAALRDATGTGLVTVGSHTHSHWLLDGRNEASVVDDLDRSIELIGEHIGTRPLDFAYPKAVPGSPAAELAVRRRFRSAALAASRVNRPGHTDAHRLWRTPIQRNDTPEFFAAKAAGGMRLEGQLRALAAKAKYRGDTR